MQFISAHWGYILGILFALSELLGQIPSIEANNVYQLFANALKGAMQSPKQGNAQ